MPEKRRKKETGKETEGKLGEGVFPRKTILKARDILVKEMEEPLPPEEGVVYEDFNEDELEPMEPEYTVFDLEPCFPPLSEIIIDLDTLEVKAVTPPEDAIASKGARNNIIAVQTLAEYLQEELQKHGHPITPEFFRKELSLTQPPTIYDAVWRTLKENLQVSLYASGKLVESLLLQEFTAPPGRPKKLKREDLLRRILQKYDRSAFSSLSRFARHIYENEEEVREEWKIGAFRKKLERHLEKAQQEDNNEK